ncbi:hypothetical protein ACHAPJ_011982 [Fusarium lateritium]
MDEPNLRWLAGPTGPEALSHGVSFGMPWPKGICQPGQRFIIKKNSQIFPLDSREVAFWADGSLKWTAHSFSKNVDYTDTYRVEAAEVDTTQGGVFVKHSRDCIHVSTTSGLQVDFPTTKGHLLFSSLTLNQRCVCSGATIVASINNRQYTTVVEETTIENATTNRVVVKVTGTTIADSHTHLPFHVRVYVYSDAASIRIVHSFIHDLDGDKPLTSLGIQFRVPLEETELYNRHIRLAGSSGGILKEEVQGLSGLRFGPTIQNRLDQTTGKPVGLSDDGWEKTSLSAGLAAIPSWSSYTLSQLSSDGFTVKKRTKSGCSWVKVTGGSRADGTAYVGSASNGGLAVGMAEFWERYPTQIDLTDLTEDHGAITMWLYSPLAEPLETMPHHDGLGLDSYEKQLEALNVTYEDYEPGFATANGIARSNELYIKPYLETPSNRDMSQFSAFVRNPPRLVPTPEYLYSTGVFHGYWAPNYHIRGITPTKEEMDLERNLDTLFNFYKGQIEQHRWYGFWDYGDVQHSYDPDRHAWRYDVGGYAWDNSELSTDLWLWLYFLHTGRADVFKMAEAMTKHTSEVDVYHSGRFKGFGTRHGVQHFSDSSKQLRISNVLYKRIYYYLTGDERTGELIQELEHCQNVLLTLDSHRKVQEHAEIPPGFAMANIGLDCGPLAASWLTAWERRLDDWTQARDHLRKLLEGLAGLRYGIANNAILLNPRTGEVRECPPPTPPFAIKHLSMLFGFPETFTELLDYAKDEFPKEAQDFRKVWLSYCKAYNGGSEVQRREYGFEFPDWPVAVEENNEELGRAAWDQFFHTDGYDANHDWSVLQASAPDHFNTGEEAPWISTNEAARYGISAIFNLANIG